LLVRRTRAGLWILLLALVLFALTELIFDRARIVPLYALKSVQLATILWAFWMLRQPERWRWAVAVALTTSMEVCITTAASGILTRDVATTSLLFIIFTTATATFLPWGARPQLAMVGVASLAALWNTVALDLPAAAVSYPAVAMVLAFVTSVYIASDSQRYHRERKHAEEALAAAKQHSDAEAEVSTALARVGREMIALVDTSVVLGRLCGVTTEVLRCGFSQTWIWTAERDAYVLLASHDPDPSLSSAEPVEVPRASIAPLLARLQREELVELDGPAGLPGRQGAGVRLHGALRHGDEIIGIHTAVLPDRGSHFSRQQRRIMEGVTRIASLALTNARLVEELGRASRVKSEFVSTISHELRTPINVILGYAEMVEEETPTTDPRHAFVRRIAVAGRELLELIESTLEIGRIDASRDEVRLESVPFRTFWTDLGLGCARLPRRPEVRFEWADGVEDTVLVTDPRKLTVVIRNLVNNALKFTERGWVRATVELDAEVIVLRVADTGIGIRQEDQELVFEMFRQADGSDSRRFGGSGLGLYIVRRFVQQLGGTISLQSAPREGSVFTIILPRSATAPSALHAA
jgi:signal transduction histidine kinase